MTRHAFSIALAIALTAGSLALPGDAVAAPQEQQPADAAQPAESAAPQEAAPEAQTAPQDAAPEGQATPQAPAAEAAPAPADPASYPEIVANVNGTEIPRADLIGSAEGMAQRLQAAGQPAPPRDDDFYRQVLDQLISTKLLYQESQAQGTTISPEELTEQVQTLEQRTGGKEQLDQALAGQDMTREELRQGLKEDLAINRYIEEKVAPAVTVSEQEAKSFYEENKERMQRPEQAKLRHILIQAGSDAAEEEKTAARTKAEGLLAQIREGADFAELATANSEDPGSKDEGGDLGWVSRGQTVEPFENAAFALEPGATSEVVESPFGFHIIRLEEKRPAGTAPFEDAREEIEAFLKQRKLGEVINRKVEELEQKATIERFI